MSDSQHVTTRQQSVKYCMKTNEKKQFINILLSNYQVFLLIGTFHEDNGGGA